jgi:hypothetical protein
MSYVLAWFVFKVFNTLAYFLLSQHVGRFDSFLNVQRSIIKGLSPAMSCLLSLLRPPSLPSLPSLPSPAKLPCMPCMRRLTCLPCMPCLPIRLARLACPSRSAGSACYACFATFKA